MTTLTHRAKDALNKLGRECPKLWDAVRKARELATWPAWCFLPISKASSVILDAGYGPDSFDLATYLRLVQKTAALAAWRMTQGIFRIDPTLYASLIKTPVTGDLPTEILLHMPHWCVYIETPGMSFADAQVHGAWCHLEHDDNEIELRFLLDVDPSPEAIIVHLGKGIEEGVKQFFDIANANSEQTQDPIFAQFHEVFSAHSGDMHSSTMQIVEPLVSLLIYLCADPEYTRGGQVEHPSNPIPVKTRRNGSRLHAAHEPTEWDVGVRMGAALKAAMDADSKQSEGLGGTHAAPRGHVRRAHWHTFRSGPRLDKEGQAIDASKRAFKVQWLPPLLVNLANIDELPSTIRKTQMK